MVQVCPITDKRIDENVTRLNAAFTFLVVLLYFLFNTTIPVFILAIDFASRGFFNGEYSLFKKISSAVLKSVNTKPQLINAGPKIFAARIGTLLSVFILVFALANAPAAAYVTGSILGFFSFLEFAFGICVACKIYPFVASLQTN